MILRPIPGQSLFRNGIVRCVTTLATAGVDAIEVQTNHEGTQGCRCSSRLRAVVSGDDYSRMATTTTKLDYDAGEATGHRHSHPPRQRRWPEQQRQAP